VPVSATLEVEDIIAEIDTRVTKPVEAFIVAADLMVGMVVEPEVETGVGVMLRHDTPIAYTFHPLNGRR
jgi:hypothetical protein